MYSGRHAWAHTLRTARRGFTLVELLVVITILMLITAATIPILAPGTETRRQREAARLVSTAFASAQTEALAAGKPVGVWIERDTSTRYAATVIYGCEVPPPYTGEFAGATVAVERITTPNHMGAVTSDPRPAGSGYVAGSVDDTYIYFRVWPSFGSTAEGRFRVGDTIQFNNQGFDYQIYHGFDTNSDGYIDDHPGTPEIDPFLVRIPKRFKDPVPGNANYESNQPYGPPEPPGNPSGGSPEDTSQRNPNYRASYLPWPMVATSPPAPPITSSTNRSGQVLFRITRQPRKSAATPIRLPEGAVIDLRFSGLDEDFGGRFFGESNTSNPPGLQPWSALGPLIVLFSAQGDLQSVYSLGAPSLTSAPSSVHFLIGKRERIMDDIPADRTDDLSDLLEEITSQFNEDVRNLPDERQLNFQDMENFWVTVQKGNGLATTSQVASIPPELANVATMPRPPDINGDGQPDYPAGFQPANWEFATWINSTRRQARTGRIEGGQ